MEQNENDKQEIRKKIQEKEKQREEIQNEVNQLKRQQEQEGLYYEDCRWVVNRYQSKIEDAQYYYRGNQAGLWFQNMSEDVEEQKRVITRESNDQYEKREKEISHLRRLREEV